MKYRLQFGCVLLLMACKQDPFRVQTPISDSWTSDSGVGQDSKTIADSRIKDAFSGDIDAARPTPDLSIDACLSMPEVCNNVDDNCNNQIDEGLDKLNDIRYCENCKGCLSLVQKHAYPSCVNGTCVITGCDTGYVDQDQKVDNGCEYACLKTGPEICDGIDNDCDKQIDEDVVIPPQTICKTLGECQNTKAQCKGSLGWQCSYGPGVELQPCEKDEDCGGGFKCLNKVCPGVVIVNEQLCDDKDGDCDGLADDPWKNPALPTAIDKDCDPSKTCNTDPDCGGAGSTCTNKKCTPKLGICRDQGKMVCDSVNKDKTICQLTTPGKTPGVETCNGLDDDCDGKVDNNVVDEEWVTVNNLKIFKYEASRPDATNQNGGIQSDGRPCSVSGRIPWANVTKEDAQAACLRAGAKLCITTDWEKACKGEQQWTFPYGNPFNPAICNGREYDATKDEALTTNLPSGCTSTWGTQTIFNMSGNVKEWTATAFDGNGKPTAYEIKGGAFDTPSIGTFGAGLSCDYDLPAPQSTLQLPTLGFRCCK